MEFKETKMPFHHTPVLLGECITGLAVKTDGVYADGTLGGGGHAYAVGSLLGEAGTLIGIDRDEAACRAGGQRMAGLACKVQIVRDNYAHIKEILPYLHIDSLDGALLDLGVSSFQLDNPERGFSYMQDAPLDMRMNTEDKLTAETIVNEYGEGDLRRIIKEYGEERWAGRIASFIVNEREKRKIESTLQLVDIIKAAIPAKARKDGPHPAKRTFQAIRIEVNGELLLLENAVKDLIDVLAPGGRLCIITFHSLEDRIVKQTFQIYANPCVCPKELPYCVCGKKPLIRQITGKPVTASLEELSENPRARSAKLRVIEKL